MISHDVSGRKVSDRHGKAEGPESSPPPTSSDTRVCVRGSVRSVDRRAPLPVDRRHRGRGCLSNLPTLLRWVGTDRDQRS